jgi:probable H4MPT-linked C1 transfer pathway protein
MDHECSSVIGIDIGGANLKYVATKHGDPTSVAARGVLAKSRFFPMWRQHTALADAIAGDLTSLARHRAVDALAITMTGELADCFSDRDEGVRHIVSHVCQAAGRLKIDDVLFYGVDGNFHASAAACRNADRIAAGNWHALASFVAQSFCSDGILIDIGSTTTDIIPIRGGRVGTAACTDHERLVEGSLVYIGGRRTPVATLLNEVRHQGNAVSIMNEFFATMDDVRIVMGLAAEEPRDCDSADGRPRTVPMAVNRLARMIGLDRRTFTTEQATSLAQQVHRSACQRIFDAFMRMRSEAGNPDSVVISGHASDLFQTSRRANVLQLSDQLGQEVSRCAPAYAVAAIYLSQHHRIGQPCDE